MTAVNAIQTFFAPILAGYPFFVYLGTYLSIILIGNVISFTTFWLAFQGEVRLWPFLGVVVLVLFADVSGDLAWYWLGRSLRDTKLGNLVYRHLPRRETIERHIRKRATRWIFLSKFIPSSTFTIIFLTGWSEVPFKKFFRVSLTAIVSSVAVLILLAYGISLGFSSLEPTALFQRFERVLILGILIFLALDFFAAKFSRRLLHGEEPEPDV